MYPSTPLVCPHGNQGVCWATSFHIPPGGSWSISQTRGVLGFTLGPPTSWTCPEEIRWKVPRRHPNQMPGPPQLPSFRIEGVAPNSPWILSSPISTSWAHPVDESHFSCMYLQLILSVTTQSSWPQGRKGYYYVLLCKLEKKKTVLNTWIMFSAAICGFKRWTFKNILF